MVKQNLATQGQQQIPGCNLTMVTKSDKGIMREGGGVRVY